MKNKLKYQFYRFLSNLTFGKLREDCYKKKNFYKAIYKSKANIFINGENNEFDLMQIHSNNVNLRIVGSGNKVIIGKNCKLNNVSINIFGNFNTILIGSNTIIYSFTNIIVGDSASNEVDNCFVKIGEYVGIGSSTLLLMEPSSKLFIGDNCAISSEIDIYVSDTHSLISSDGELLNYGTECRIGNHVWIGKSCKIGKNACIPNNTVVGWNSTVMGKFKEENTVIAGNPTKVIKRGVNWNYQSPKAYLDMLERKKERIISFLEYKNKAVKQIA